MYIISDFISSLKHRDIQNNTQLHTSIKLNSNVTANLFAKVMLLCFKNEKFEKT